MKAKIYVASSWRNEQQPGVVQALRADGHEVYDFKDSQGFHWEEVDPNWKQWVHDVPSYLDGLQHPAAERGFDRDMNALRACDVCVYVMPCGVSASWEAGWAVGAGKRVYVYVPGLREPDLMVKMAYVVTGSLAVIREEILAYRPALPQRNEAQAKALRYERFLRTMVDLRTLVDDGSANPIYPSLSHQDTMEWLEEQASNLLDFGMEATCPHCSTDLHEGACVAAESEED